jgi:hypothetical protein
MGSRAQQRTKRRDRHGHFHGNAVLQQIAQARSGLIELLSLSSAEVPERLRIIEDPQQLHRLVNRERNAPIIKPSFLRHVVLLLGSETVTCIPTPGTMPERSRLYQFPCCT